MQIKHFVDSLARFVVVVVELEVHYQGRVKRPWGHLGSHPWALRYSSSSQIVSFEPLFSCMQVLGAARFHQKCSLATFHVV